MSKNSIAPIMPTYNRFDVGFERGEGMYIYDTEGKEYLDFISGIAVSALGHNHPHLVSALTEQAGKLWHTSNMYRIPEQERLAERLVGACSADAVFFTNSGVEAIECCIKAARKYMNDAGHPERYRVITFKNAFHGRSMATIAAAKKEALTKGFGPMPEGFDQVPFLDIEAARAAITDETAAFLIEPVQGEGGIRPASAEDLQALRALADEFGLLLIVDEIQCGMGRTGKLFAYEWAGIEPDLIGAAKGIGGGFPLGACLAKGSVAKAMHVGTHGSTYGGNPLASAVGNAILDVMLADGFFDHVVEMGDYLMAALNPLRDKHPEKIVEVRGKGLMLGIEMTDPVRPLQEKLLSLGMLSGAAGPNVLRLLPPLVVEPKHIDAAVKVLDDALSDD